MSVVKKMSGAFSITTFVALTAIAGWSCGGDSEETTDGGNNGEPGMGGGDGGVGASGCNGDEGVRPDRDLVLINVTGSSSSEFIGKPSKVEVIDGDGKSLSPAITAMSNTSGQFKLGGAPCSLKGAWIHVTGTGTTDEDTYDSLSLSAPDSGDNLIRASFVGTVKLAEMTGGFTAKDDKVAIGGAVYRVDAAGKRIGTVGCARIYMDGTAHPKEGVDQRYVQGALPTTWATRDRTERTGKFYFGNVDKGEHTFKVSVDNGQTFLKLRPIEGGEATESMTIKVPFVRSEAKGPYKSFLALFGLDVVGADPTPADCPPDA